MRAIPIFLPINAGVITFSQRSKAFGPTHDLLLNNYLLLRIPSSGDQQAAETSDKKIHREFASLSGDGFLDEPCDSPAKTPLHAGVGYVV
jgi:hypothetical protein